MAVSGPLKPAMTLTVTESLVTPGADPPPDPAALPPLDGPPAAVRAPLPLAARPPADPAAPVAPPPPLAPAAEPEARSPPSTAVPSSPIAPWSPPAADADWAPVRTEAASLRGVDTEQAPATSASAIVRTRTGV